MVQGTQPLSGKVALVTGASRGIGAAAAVKMAQWGASVVINYLENKERALEVLKEVEKAGSRGIVVQADVTRQEAVAAMRQSVKKDLGDVDILVNNAFFPFKMSPLQEIPWEALHEALTKEIAAFYNCTQAFVPGMMQKKSGRVIVVSTRLAKQPLPRMGAYASAKSALETMADTMAMELGPMGITVNTVTPAFTITDASKVMPEEFKERVRKTRPLQKHLYPENIAGTIAFLAGPDADMVTGTNILVTGGSHLQL